jgi:hypothetical protein
VTNWPTNPNDPLQVQVDIMRELARDGAKPTVRVIRCKCRPGAWPCECESTAEPWPDEAVGTGGEKR